MTGQAHVEIEHRFAMMPEALLYDPSISADAVRVFGVLLRHGSDPSNCYPSHARIAGFIGRSKASINGWIVELERSGWVERVPRTRSDGSPDSNGYRLFMTAARPEGVAGERGVVAGERGGVPAAQRGPSSLHSAPNESNVNESHGERENDGGASSSTEQLALVDKTPAAQHQAVGQNLGSDRDLAFVEFWNVFPRKVGKGQARKAWATARRRGVLPEVIVAGARRYRDDPGRDPAYTRHAATWLNGEGWDDEPTPVPQPSPQRPRTAMGSTIAGLRQIAANGRNHPALEAPR